jgi:hypothetical protein
MPQFCRTSLAFVVAALLAVPSSFALTAPLSEEAVREAYFLGMRHDGSLLGSYFKSLPPPKTGPHISSVTFLTPFAQLVQFCSQRIGSYSAQQAWLDHSGQQESVKIIVEIQLTASYGALVPVPADSRSKSSPAFLPRPHDFWKDFHVRIFDGDELLSPSESNGHANYRCGRRGPCVLTGATLEFEFGPAAFASDTATIEVTPPEGDPVFVDFNLPSLR